MGNLSRHDGRAFDMMRPMTIEPGYVKYPHGSVLISSGDTKVICTVVVDERVPPYVASRGPDHGWITAEYALMPGSGLTRNARAGYGSTQVKGRVHEIQRLIGRALRAAIDLTRIGPRTLMIDCDVLQADGGTRTASVTGAMVALELAVRRLMSDGKLAQNPLLTRVAAVSVGIVGGEILLDLDYHEDSNAQTDLNLVMTREGGFIEVQGTAEHGAYSAQQLTDMVRLGEHGIQSILHLQNDVLERCR